MTRLVTDFLDESAAKYPDKMAFADNKRELTYKQLQSEAKHIGQSLINLGLFKSPVAIYLDKNVESVAAFMGAAYSGNFYTPIDIKMPLERCEKIINTLKPLVIITDSKNIKKAQEILPENAKLLVYEECQQVSINDEDIHNALDKVIDTDLLYILFTSGSTGIPKGVVISHKALITYINWTTETFDFNSETIFGSQTPFYFSMSILDLFSTLKSGASFYIIPKMLFSFPVRLLEFVRDKKINTIYWVPTALSIVANMETLGTVDISCLKKILFAGEVMPAKQLNMWIRELPDAMFANLYGPTEVTDISNYWVVDRPISDNEPVPIGKACKNTDVLILNDKDELIKDGEMGELCIRGSELSYGYYNNPEKTKEAFVQNPINKLYPEIIYRTGDLVRYNEKGELVYVCRKDFQIKHMGHRIELGEIETAVSAINGIQQNCCLYNTEKGEIVLFYTGSVSEDEVYAELKKAVPVYMLPNKKVKLPVMPLNLNGKIDRVKLKTMF